MKARVKSTGMIVEVNKIVGDDGERYYKDRAGFPYQEHHLDFDIPSQYEPDYWTRLEHQYAGMAMQQLVTLVNVGYEYVYEETAIIASNFAHALVEKMKEVK